MNIGSRPRLHSDLFVSLAFLLLLLPLYVLPPPRPLQGDFDSSWQFLLTTAFRQGAQFGRDIVYNYGPWALVVVSRGDSGGYLWLVAGRLLFACAMVFGIARIASRHLSGWRRAAWMALVLAVANPPLVVPLVLLVDRGWGKPSTGQAGRTVTTLLILACGLAMWTKFTAFVLIAVLCAVLLARDVLCSRWPVPTGGILLSAAFFWKLAGQSLSALPSFVRTNLSLALSYSEAQAVPGKKWVILTGTLLCALVVWAAALDLVGRRVLLDVPAFAFIVFFIFVGFKEAFVRQDSFHLLDGMVGSVFPAAFVILAASPPAWPGRGLQSGEGLRHMLATVNWTVLLVLGAIFSSYLLETDAGRWVVSDVASSLTSVFRMPTPSARTAAGERDREQLRHADPIDPIPGTTDLFPDRVGILAANGLSMRLRPVPQAFVAINEFLTGLNASFLRGPKRPDHVLFEIAPIDGRHPMVEDPLSLLALLSCYQPAGFTGHYLLLDAAGCLEVQRTLILDTNIDPGKPVQIPPTATEPIWAEIVASPSAVEAISKTLLHLPPLQLAVNTDGQHTLFTLPRELAKVGFLLSPNVPDPVSFGLLYSQHLMNLPVRSFAVDWTEGIRRRLFRRPAHIRLYSLSLPRRGNTAIPSPLLVQYARTVRAEAGQSTEAGVSGWSVRAGQPRVRVNSSSTGKVSVPPGTAAIKIAYGTQNLCGDLPEPLSRVRFFALWYSSGSTSPELLLDRTLEARGTAEPSAETVLALPRGPGQLILRTEPAGGGCFAGAWWSDLSVSTLL
jgi:hypothetical protein